ncbi:DUF1697 domain-containing protein [Muricauda sp. JGD-17]|uniref:DUF1697 domain-containing protein n=1 Tax=Flagellimonas ochracea TaxID=2696472 RepID=A0A964TDN1_9FLAO|nr:DUF1697 domain-containing protein [Allomuricauda ochracea]NAY92073.1 DUF1697 domain-containing protein [Allomuricauda ochracea]
MQTYVALLRGINVSGQKKILMPDLKATFENIGLKRVVTYIQSGNIVFESTSSNIKELETSVHRAILRDFGFDVPILVMAANDIVSILESNPFAEEKEKKGLYFVLLKETPNKERVSKFNNLKFEDEEYYIISTCVYLNCKAGYGKAKLNNNLIERKLKVEATTRNWKTMQKLLELAEQIKD